MPFNLSTGELLVLLVVAILVFGGRLPEVARKVARGVGDFRRGMNEELRRIETHATVDDDAAPPDWSQPPDGADCDGFGRIDSDGSDGSNDGSGEPEDSQEPEAEARRSAGASEPKPEAPEA